MTQGLAPPNPTETTSAAPPEAASGPHAEPATDAPTAEAIKRKAVRSGVWTVFAYGSSQGIRFAANIVLARVLLPEDWGLMGLVTIILIGLQMFSDIGIGPAIVQNDRTDDRFVNTAFTVQAVRGVVLWLAAAALAWPLAAFTDRPELLVVLPVAAVSSLLLGLQSTNWFTANRHLAVKWMMLLDLSAIAIQAVVMIVWAYAIDASVWALVVGVLVYTVIRVVGSHFLPGHRNRFAWDPAAASAMFHFGKWLFVSTVITFLGGYLDKLLLSSWTDAVFFGLFWIAFQLAELGPVLAFKLGSMVGFPALAEVQRNRPQDLDRELFRVRRALLLPITAILLGILLFAPALFFTLYEPKYWPAGWIAQALVLSAIANQLNMTYAHAYLATGRTHYNLIGVTAHLVLVLLCVTVGHQLGGQAGFVLGLVAAPFLKYPVDATLAARLGVNQWKWDLKLMAGTTLACVALLWLSLITQPYAIAAGQVIQGVTNAIKAVLGVG